MISTNILTWLSEMCGFFAARTRRLRISRADKKLHEKYGVFLNYIFFLVDYVIQLTFMEHNTISDGTRLRFCCNKRPQSMEARIILTHVSEKLLYCNDG